MNNHANGREDHFADRNMEFASEFMLMTFREPEKYAHLDGATIVFMPDDDPEFAAHNEAIAEKRRQEGRNVVVLSASVLEKVAP